MSKSKRKICLGCKFPIFNRSPQAVYCKECITLRHSIQTNANSDIQLGQNKIHKRKIKELTLGISIGVDIVHGKDMSYIPTPKFKQEYVAEFVED